MKEFDTNRLCGGHCFIIGESSAKDAVIREMLSRHSASTRALIVLDYDGRFYESYGGEAVLADFSSAGSVVPDLLETLLHSSHYGRNPKIFALMMQRLLSITKPDRTSNDAFWSVMSSAAFKQYVEYLCALYKVEKFAVGYDGSSEVAGGNKNDFVLLGKFAGIMTNIMYKSTVCKDPATFIASRPDSSPIEKYLESYVKASAGEGAKPFDGSLRNPGAQNASTYQNVYMSMLANCNSFFKAMELFERDGDALARLSALNMRSFVSGGSAPLFFCGTRRADANQALGALMLMSAACAAHDSGTSVTVVIPELERWNLYWALKYVKEECFDGLSTVTSCGDIWKFASAVGLDKRSLLGELSETSDSRLWLYTTDTDCENVFASEAPARERCYKLCELDGGYCAYRRRRSGLEYFVLPDAGEEKKIRTRTPLAAAASRAWIDVVKGREKELIKSAACCGLPPALYTALKEMGYVKEEIWWKRAPLHDYLALSPYGNAYEILADFFSSDTSRLTKRERAMFCANGKSALQKDLYLKYLTCHDIRMLIGRANVRIKKMRQGNVGMQRQGGRQ